MRKIIMATLLVAACGSQNNYQKSHEEIHPIRDSSAAIIFTKDGPTIVITKQEGVGGEVRGEAALAKIIPIATRKFSDGSGCLFAPFIAEVSGNIYKSDSGSDIIELSSVDNARYSNSDEVENITRYRLKQRAKAEDICR